MIGLRHVLAPPPPWLTPRRVALAAIAAIAAIATLCISRAVPESARMMGAGAGPLPGSPPSAVATLHVVATTTALTLALGWRALRSASTLHARLWLVMGGAAAGAVAVVIAWAGVRALLAVPEAWNPMRPIERILVAGVVVGGPLGFLFGTAYAPIVTAAMRAEEAPSHDGLDRVVLTAGAVLLAAAAACARLAPPAWAGGVPWGWIAAAAATGALAMGGAAVRMLRRVRLLARVRDGEEPGFHVVPRSGREDEAPLVPLVRSEHAPEGVLAATGVSAPYRGARGIFKLALAPLSGDPVARPFAELFWAGLAMVSHALITLMAGAAAALVLSPLVVLVVVSML